MCYIIAFSFSWRAKQSISWVWPGLLELFTSTASCSLENGARLHITGPMNTSVGRAICVDVSCAVFGTSTCPPYAPFLIRALTPLKVFAQPCSRAILTYWLNLMSGNGGDVNVHSDRNDHKPRPASVDQLFSCYLYFLKLISLFKNITIIIV